MKKHKVLVLILSFLFIQANEMHADQNPIANPDAIVISGDMRFTVLTPEMIRIEWRSGADKEFEDHATFAIINRRLSVPEYTTKEENGFLYIETAKLKLQYRIGSFPGTFDPASSRNLKITFPMDGRTVTWYPWKKDALNLKGTCRTLDSSNGDNKRSELENGLVSRSGWAVIDDTETRSDGSKSLLLEENAETGFDWFAERADKAGMDWYFMGYGHDYKKALYDFTRIAGKIPMPPLYAFGYWYSKYQKYNEQDFKDLVTEMEDNDVPLDVMVVDTDWHINGWTGWSWNKALFPDPSEFLGWLHNKDLKVTLNLHPAYGVQNNEDNYQQFVNDLGGVPAGTTTVAWNLENPKFYQSLFNNILRPHENIGVDFWWLDWQQELLSGKVDGLGHTYGINYVFFKDMEKTYPGKRTMIFHRWGGLGNHRYQIGFSGDSHSNFPTLAFQPYFTATASNVGYGYWGHDLGGHVQNGDNNPELYLRWIQFGVFSPLLRTHSTNAENIERRIWKYPNFKSMKEAFELRYALVPYIYTQAREAYDTGVSICRPLYYDHPECNEAYDYEGEYMFGDDILVSPITKAADASGLSKEKIWLPEGNWYEACSGTLLEGGQTYTRTFGPTDIPYYYKAGSIIPNYPKVSNLKHRPTSLLLKFIPGESGETKLYEDENDTEGYKDGKYTFTRITQEYGEQESTYTIYPAEGSFDGMPQQRNYHIELLYIEKPENVQVNGKQFAYNENGEAGTWKYNAETKTATIYTPVISCTEQTTISVKQNTTAIEKEELAQEDGHFYYNREQEELEIRFGQPQKELSLGIYNLSGIKQYEATYYNEYLIIKSLARWSKGVNLCHILADGKNYIYKFIK